MAVVGAGFGGLVDAALRASDATRCKLDKIIAIEKNGVAVDYLTQKISDAEV